jgi:lipopolysaccharide/colanic/teichoic acid biosynthesis glycosyltransferase
MSKRFVDLVLGTALAILASPLIVVFAVASAVVLRAWPFFVQERVGIRGKPFRIVKLRTLPRSAPSHAHKFVIAGIPLPRFASFLRSTHLDELPQLFLVSRGVMSLVGPRPEMIFLHETGDDEFARRRVSVRPGCTGLWQISRAATGLIWEAAEYDIFYVEHACLRLDLWILVRTVLGIFPSGRVISLHDVPGWVLRGQRSSSSAHAVSDPLWAMGQPTAHGIVNELPGQPVGTAGQEASAVDLRPAVAPQSHPLTAE